MNKSNDVSFKKLYHLYIKMDEEDEHFPSVFYYPKDLETFDAETETGITKCHIINYLLT